MPGSMPFQSSLVKDNPSCRPIQSRNKGEEEKCDRATAA
jgi:hypothetical protein